MNPSLNANSALRSPHDEDEIVFSDVAFGSKPFDWSVGYDTEKELGITIPIKDQDGSGSCGGQAESYGGAKFTYAPVAYPPTGGSSGIDLSNRSIQAGWGSEALTPSYEANLPPSEAFMERKEDITPEAIAHASLSKALSPVLVLKDIDQIAQAIRDYKFVRLGVTGSNNGTWRTADPIPPVDGDTLWYHWVAGLKAGMRNGKKAIGFANSWGINTGDKGWQWLNEDWFKVTFANNPYGSMPIFEPRAYVWNDQILPPTFQHTFSKDLYYGLIDPENQMLQTALRIEKCFPDSIPYNDRFGTQTKLAVIAFQKKYGINPIGRCGPVTRAKLNSIYSHTTSA
jgi:peptidoglycan hydrolase-like protein with peptidoglycan-binding domain